MPAQELADPGRGLIVGLVLAVGALGLYSALARILLYLRLRRDVPGLWFLLLLTVPYLELKYLEHRRRIRTRSLDWLAASAALSFALAFDCALVALRLAHIHLPSGPVPLRGE